MLCSTVDAPLYIPFGNVGGSKFSPILLIAHVFKVLPHCGLEFGICFSLMTNDVEHPFMGSFFCKKIFSYDRKFD